MDKSALTVKFKSPKTYFEAIFKYKLDNHLGRWYTKSMKFYNLKRLKGVPYSFIECFIRFLIQNKVITPNLLEYSYIVYLKTFIVGEISNCWRFYNDSTKSAAMNTHFMEFVLRYQQGDLFETGVNIEGDIPSDDSSPPKGVNLVDPVDVSVFPRDGIFKPDFTGKSYLLLGSSFSGKTTFIVENLKKLFPLDYDLICLFTETKNSEPLKELPEDLPIKIFEGWQPQIPQFLKEINDQCDNKFKFLCILDDIVDAKLSKTLNKLILTFRNSNISTVISIQYPKLISKASRSSFHEVVVLGSRSVEWWKAVCDTLDIKEWWKDRMLATSSEHHEVGTKPSADEIFKSLKKATKSPKNFIYINQREGKEPTLV